MNDERFVLPDATFPFPDIIFCRKKRRGRLLLLAHMYDMCVLGLVFGGRRTNVQVEAGGMSMFAIDFRDEDHQIVMERKSEKKDGFRHVLQHHDQRMFQAGSRGDSRNTS